jgi:4-amino-4-deoxy-L-arabinose transferase-like glycosyltransferase
MNLPPASGSRSRSLGIIAALWLFLYGSFALLSPLLLDDADSVHAEVAREMIQRHDWVTLYANGIRYLEKAPLLYWSMAASMRTFGVSTAAARFPLAIYALLLFLLTYWFGRSAFRSERTGLYAGVGLLLSFGLFIFTRILIPDAVVCLWLTAAIFCFWMTEDREQRGFVDVPLLPCIGFGIACALNILTKGLIGLVFPLGTMVLYLLTTRGVRGTLRRLWQLHPFATLAVFLVVAAPWHVFAGMANPTEGNPAGLTHPGPLLPWFWRGWQVGSPTDGSVHGWTWFYFMNEHLLRYLNLRVPRDYDTVPLLLFWVLVLVWTMPWSAFAWKAMQAAPWRKALARKHAAMDTEEKATLLLAIATLLPIVFFSFSTRQEYYVLPSLPFLLLLIARWLDREAAEAEAMTVPSVRTGAGLRITTVLLVGLLHRLCAAYARRRPCVAAEAEPRRICTFVWPFPRPYGPGHGPVPQTSPAYGLVAVPGYRVRMVAAAQLSRAREQHRPGRSDVRFPNGCAHGTDTVRARPQLRSPCQSRAAQPEPGGPHRHQRGIRGGFHTWLLPAAQ